MKKIITKFMTLLALVLTCVSCDKGTPEIESFGSDDTGYLNISSFNVVTKFENEYLPTVKSVSKTVVEDVSNYYVTIEGVTNPTYSYKVKYSEIGSEPLELEPGNYTITASSVGEIPALSDTPTYSGSNSFTIMKNETTTFNETITCYLSNVKVTITFSADLKDIFAPDGYTPEGGEARDLEATIKLGGDANRISSFNRSDVENGKIVYFAGDVEGEALEILLSGYYNTASEDATPVYALIENWSQSISNVKPGEWRKIELNIPGVTDGNVQFGVTVDTWVYGEMLDVDIQTANYLMQSSLSEDILEVPENSNPQAPIISGDGVASTFEITKDLFDLSLGTCSDLMDGVVTPAVGASLKSVELDFSECGSGLKFLLTTYGVKDNRATVFPNNSLTNLVVRESGENGCSYSLNFTAMKNLYNQCFGDNKVLVVATDNLDRTSYTYVNIKVITEESEFSPSVIWNGHDFDTRYFVDPDNATPTEYIINIISNEYPISGFTLSISSELLPASELSSVGLASYMDLVNPDPSIIDGLNNLGIPYGDGVENQSEVEFNINAFIPMLSNLNAAVEGNKNHDFTLTVSNERGLTTRTLKLTTYGK